MRPSVESGSAIRAARAAYDALTAEQQALVPEQQVQARIWEMQEQQAAMTTMS